MNEQLQAQAETLKPQWSKFQLEAIFGFIHSWKPNHLTSTANLSLPSLLCRMHIDLLGAQAPDGFDGVVCIFYNGERTRMLVLTCDGVVCWVVSFHVTHASSADYRLIDTVHITANRGSSAEGIYATLCPIGKLSDLRGHIWRLSNPSLCMQSALHTFFILSQQGEFFRRTLILD